MSTNEPDAASAARARLTDVEPGALGLSADRLAQIDAHFGEMINSGAMAGFAYAIARRGKIAHRAAIGFADIESGQAIGPDTVFRLASMTKPITAVALMMLYDDGKFRLDDPISDYLPEFAQMTVLRDPMSDQLDTDPAACPITIRHILQHSAGLGLGLGLGAIGEALLLQVGPNLPGEDLATQMSRISSVPLSWQPGTMWSYSLSPDVQARLVEVLAGQEFTHFLEKRIFGPLGMHDTAFAMRPDMIDRLAHIYWHDGEQLVPWSAESVPPVPPMISAWPEPFATLHDPASVHTRGSFGLHSTLNDYLLFAQMLHDGGSLNGVRILSAETIKLMTTDSLGNLAMIWPVQGLGFGLGFAVLRDPAAAGYAGTPGMYHWDGALGTIMWIDPERDLVVVGMAQHFLIPELTPDALGAVLRNHVYAALED